MRIWLRGTSSHNLSTKCRFYHEDSHRKSHKKECRLIQRNPASEPWEDRFCGNCPVPEILKHNPCANLALEGEVTSRWGFFPKVHVFAVCALKMDKVADPTSCRHGCAHFSSLY